MGAYELTFFTLKVARSGTGGRTVSSVPAFTCTSKSVHFTAHNLGVPALPYHLQQYDVVILHGIGIHSVSAMFLTGYRN